MSLLNSLSIATWRLKSSTPAMVWVMWWAFTLAATLLVVAGWRVGDNDLVQASTAQLHLQQTRQQLPTPLGPVPARDFAVALGPPLLLTKFLAALDRAAADAGVSMASVVVSEQPATAADLGRIRFAVVLKGSYAASKQVLTEVLAHFNGAGVQSLRMRVDAATGTVETTDTLSRWSAPLRLHED